MNHKPSSYLIRPMEATDVEQVVGIEQSLFSKPWRAEDFLSSVDAEDRLYLVVDNAGQIAGYCGLQKILDEGDITNVAVKSECHNQGIGSEMLKVLLERGEQMGIAAFTLEVRIGNTSARRVYEKLGFVSAGVRKNFYEKPVEDAVIMWRY